MSLTKIFAVRALAFVKVGYGIEPQAVDAHLEPEVECIKNRLMHLRIGEVQVRLMRVETVPIVGFGYWIPRPVGRLEVLENNPCLRVTLLRLAPNVEIARAGAGLGVASADKPRMLIGGMINDQLGNNPDTAFV